MSTHLLRPTAVATIDATDVDLAAGTTRLDSSAVPYASASLEFPLLEDELLEWLDPRDGVRVPYEAGDESGTPRPFDLSLRGREVDHAAKRVRLTLAGDEALLIKYKQLTLDSGARVHEASLRAVCDYVLAKIGASLEPGTEDADVTAYFNARNMILDPGTAASPGGGYTSTGCTIDFHDPSWSVSGDGDSYNLHTPTSTESFMSLGGDVGTLALGMRAGGTYVFSASGNTKVAFTGTPHADPTRQRALVVHYRVGTGPYSVAISNQVPNVINTPTRVAVEFTLPEGVTECFLRAYLGNTAGQIRWDGFRLSERGPGTVDDDAVYFDGDTPDTAAYIYAWEGVQDITPSTRTAVVERRPELFTLKPGMSLWNFLLPITSSAGMVLWCDELRRWYLAFPESRSLPVLISVSEWNTSLGVDGISLDDEGAVVSGVVVIYRWTDENGARQERYDAAGDPENAITVELDQPYPGPGAAGAILARRQGSGRRQTVTTITQHDTTPGMTAQISLPGAPDTIGRVQSVEFNHATGFMDLGAAGLVDIIPGSVDALVGTVDALVGTVDSL